VVLYDYDSECPSGEFTAYRDHHCSTLGAPNGSANVKKCYESEVELHRRIRDKWIRESTEQSK
jgi:hypothetical protein